MPGNAKCIEGIRDMAFLSFLDQELSVAHPGYRRVVPRVHLRHYLPIQISQQLEMKDL